MALGIGVSFGASAGLVYNNEFTTDWFDAGVQNLKVGDELSSPWQVPKEAGAVTVGSKKITLDTDLEDPLSYGAPSAYSNVAVVAATFTVTPNAACPEIADAPQAALTVVASGGSTNWVGLVGDNGTNKWETFAATSDVPAPVAGETYAVSILFDQRSTPKKIRYLVNGEFLGSDWVANPSPTSPDISSVSFSGSGDITALAGTNILETAATFDGQSFSTFDAALAAAEKGGSGWGPDKVIMLYKPGTFAAKNDGTFYFNDTTGGLLTITGGVYKRDGNAYAVTTYASCEARIGDQYYAKFADAFDAAADNQTIVILKSVANVGALDVAKSLTLSGCANLSGCTALTVAAGKTLTLTGAFAVGNATVNGSVAGDALVVSGTLNGTAVNSLTFAADAIFTYAGTALAPATLALPASGTVTITGIESLANGDPIITATELEAAKFTGAPNGRVFKVEGGSLTLAPGATITKTTEDEGFDYTNGTVSVTASVESGKTGTATLKVIDFATGNVIETYESKAIGGDALTWQLADELTGGQLTPGGTYSYVVEVEVDNVVVATKAGTFTAAKWDDDIWFGADASKSTDRELNGSWESTKKPAVVGNAYVIEEDALFNVSETVVDKGTNHVTRVDAVVTFESLIDTDSLESDETEDALGGFVAAKSSDVPQWMALTKVDNAVQWVALAGDIAPEANVQYVVRAEIDFQSASKRVRYLVSTDGTDFAPLALEDGTQWLALADANKETLAKVELKGAGSLAKFEAWIADKAVAEVDGKKYDSMDAAFEAAGTNGEHAITLLTNATVEPTKPGSYDIAPNNFLYASGGQISTDRTGTKSIVVTEDGPVVRPSTTDMKLVQTPEGKQFKDVNSLRAFLERNGVEAYTTNYEKPQDITTALQAVPQNANGLALWQDYALGIDKTDSVAPVTIPTGDTNPNKITLSIPKVAAAIAADKPSGDYSFSFKVLDANDDEQPFSGNVGAIEIPLTTGTYRVMVIFTATPAQEQAK